MTTGQKIKYIRLLKRLTQRDVTEKLNMSQQAYSRLETDQTKPTHDQMKKLTEALGISLEDLDKWDGKFVFNNFGNPSNNGQINQFKSLVEDERGLYQQLVAQKDTEIGHLRDEVAYLKTVIDRLMGQ